MAIARRTSSSANAGSGTSIALTKPTSLADNDVLVAAVATRNVVTGTISGPAGWSTVGQAGASGINGTVALFYKVVTSAAGEAASYTFSWTTSAQNSGVIVRYDGEDTATPSDVAGSTNSGAAALTGTWTGITTATAGAMLIGAMCANSGTATFSAEDAPLTEIVDVGTNQSLVLTDGLQTSAGASGNKNATLSASRDWSAVLWALRPVTSTQDTPELYGRPYGAHGQVQMQQLLAQ